MSNNISGKYCIIGTGATSWGKHPGRSTESLNIEAIRKAISDANIDKGDIDAVLCKMPTTSPGLGYSLAIAQRLGLTPKVTGVLDQEGATMVGLVEYAIMCMELGQCEVAVISYADYPRTGPNKLAPAPSEVTPFGWLGAPSSYAMIARRHMSEFGTTHEQLGAIAVAFRKHGAMNPNAQLQKAITLDDYLARPWIAEPLRADDCCVVSDGGGAIIVTSTERARSMGVEKPVKVLGLGQGHPSWDVSYRETLTTSGAAVAGRQAFGMAGLTTADIDVAQLYDCFSIVPLITFEDYGFCAKGEGGAFCEGGRIEVGGELPTNTSGGLLSETGSPGIQLIIEAVSQLRGNGGERQVANAKTALVSNQGGIMQTHATMILSTEGPF